ncbi:MAG: META domain-containing protein [Cyclobacteriaceae bacterium]
MYAFRKLSIHFALPLSALLLLSCKAQEVSLRSTAWKLVRIENEDLTTFKEPITLEFSDDQARISGFGGCNRYFGSCRLSGNQITFSQIGSTKMFCQETQHIEDTFFRLLNEADSFEAQGDKLLLRKDGTPTLQFSRKQ